MRKAILIIIAVLAFYAPAEAMGNRSYNAKMFGSDDHQRKHTVQVDDRPVHQVPEPSVIYLLGGGLVGLALWARRDRG